MIRIADINDSKFIHIIEKKYINDKVTIDKIIEEINNDNYIYYVYDDDCIKGYLSINMSYDTCDIINIAVEQNYRNQKIASRLINNLLEYLKQSTIERILLEVELDNTMAIQFYKKIGFEEINIRKNYYGLERHASIMQLTIK